MSSPKWTKNQELAIKTPPRVLVNAAAGSGKTAVLVERIIRKIKNGETDIDRLLVVTFARDAAEQMRSRIKKALGKAIAESSDTQFNKRMRKQLRLLKISDITTIDAFCINAVKRNFHILGMDPAFKIIDTEEAKIMLSEAIKKFLDDMYEEEDERLSTVSEHYSDGFSDYSLQKMLEELYTFTRSLKNPTEWVKEKANMYKDFKSSVWYEKIQEQAKPLKEQVKKYTNMAAERFMLYALGEVKEISGLTDEEIESLRDFDNKGLWDEISEDLKRARAMESDSWDDVFEAASGFSNTAKTAMSGDFKEERKEIIDIKNKAFENASKIKHLYFCSYSELPCIYEQGIYPVISAFAELFCEFDEYFLKMKHKKNSYEFNDLEHICYNLLKSHEDVRHEYANKYDEILMDEYQDTNALQEAIFDLVSDKRFMVGDMKQSIYRFRSSDPLIFKEKDKRYFKNPEDGTRIVLSENFRSRPQVLNSINEIFKRIMSEEAGEVEYDNSQALKWGNKSYESPENDKYFSELYILEGKNAEAEEDESDTLVEARFIAKKIKSMIDEGFEISDGSKMRPVRPGDFVIIQNAVKSTGSIFMSELKKVGLDSFCENEGYFEKMEIKLMLSLIDVINNPLRDIPLVAVMRSVVFGFSEDELARIRINLRGDFFNAVEKTARGEGELSKKCKSFLECINRWRDYAKYMSADKLIWTIYEETNFYDLMGVLYGGEEAQANLRLLFEKARQYEKTGFKGLFHFVEYIKKIEQGAKSSGAFVISDSSNIVKIMTIHKSKGLEFPICILAGAGKRFNNLASGNLKLHKELGIGVRFVDAEDGYYTKTSVCELISAEQRREEQAENLRKLYVGMTRAKEKLIVVATVKGINKNSVGGYTAEKERWNTIYNPSQNYMNPEAVNGANKFVDWIAPIVLSHKSECGWKSFVIPYSGGEDEEVTQNENVDFEEISDELIEKLMNVSYESSRELPGKISVTGIEKLKERFETDDDLLDFAIENKHTDGLKKYSLNLKRPAFLEDLGLTGAERGTAYHTVLSFIELCDDMSEEYIKDQTEKMLSDGRISQNEKNCINADDLVGFFNSELGERLIKSDTVLREAPFEIPVGADEITGVSEHKGNEILLQGVIDCMFEESGELVLVDYKTDKNMTENELKEHYKNQLLWYKKAAQRLCGKNVKETVLYSFSLKKTINI